MSTVFHAPELIVITGPTASGKTAAAVELALQLNTEVISADSMQVYRHLRIGTAKPDAEELRGVPYHLIDCVEPEYQYNAGDFVEDAERIIARLASEQKIPIVCGGTGMYIRSLVHGIFREPSRNPAVRMELEQVANERGLDVLYRRLMEVDPEATHIMPNDRKRIIRALEVFQVTGQPITSLQSQSHSPPRYRAAQFVLSLPRTELYDRINARVDRMVEQGIVAEVRAYLAAGRSRANPAIRALGYEELIAHLDGQTDLPAALEMMKMKSRNYAKRQLTWFRSMHETATLDVSQMRAPEVAAEIKKRLAMTGV